VGPTAASGPQTRQARQAAEAGLFDNSLLLLLPLPSAMQPAPEPAAAPEAEATPRAVRRAEAMHGAGGRSRRTTAIKAQAHPTHHDPIRARLETRLRSHVRAVEGCVAHALPADLPATPDRSQSRA
jgi:hypothetical protein